MGEGRPPAWALIPARGGSKGIVGKNMRLIQGRSLVRRAVEAARGAQTVERVFVSTDHPAIADEARRAGAEVIERPASLAGDEASSESVLLHAVEVLDGEAFPELLVFLQCTSPFVSADDIDGTVRTLLAHSADTAHTVVTSHGFLWRQAADCAEGVNHDKAIRPRRQDRQAEFLETGAVYVMRTAGFRHFQHRFFGKTVLHEVPATRAIEIDTPDDLALARIIAPLVEEPLCRIRIPDPLGGIVFDFDGVLTDNTVFIDANGVESVSCHRGDGFGIEMLRSRKVRMAVLSRERNGVVAERCKKLQLDCIQACDNKLGALLTLCSEWNTSVSNIVFVGNDLPDAECIAAAGLGVAVGDAHPQIKAIADLVLPAKGGKGAVRALCELVIGALDV